MCRVVEEILQSFTSKWPTRKQFNSSIDNDKNRQILVRGSSIHILFIDPVINIQGQLGKKLNLEPPDKFMEVTT